jgi:hypothetical protein
MARSHRHASTFSLALALAGALAWGCASNGSFNGDDWTPGSSGATGSSSGGKGETQSSSSGGSSGSSGGVSSTGLPCDVEGMLQRSCTVGTCHQSGSKAGGLHTYAELTAPTTDPGIKVADVALAEMRDGSMPPRSAAAAGDVAILDAWIKAGYPRGACSTPTSPEAGAPKDAAPEATTPDPFAGPAVCTSGDTNPPATGISMGPGRACGACHTNAFAGTVYPTGHEPDDCRGINGNGAGGTDAKIFVTGADGATKILTVFSHGNFKVSMAGVKLPYSVKVVVGTKERVMLSKTSNGDCNACHTQAGKNGAPGRILAP